MGCRIPEAGESGERMVRRDHELGELKGFGAVERDCLLFVRHGNMRMAQLVWMSIMETLCEAPK